MPDWKLDPITGDVTNALTNDATGETTAQLVRCRLHMFLGEWFLDNTIGVDYIGKVFIKSPNLGQIAALLRGAILGTPGVLSLLSYSQSLNTATRKLTVTCSIKDDLNNIITIQEALTS